MVLVFILNNRGRNKLTEETLQGIVERVTFHSEVTGWSVLRVNSFRDHDSVTVTVHQMRVFAGATIKFFGHWTNHPKFGRQFKALRAEEQKPATSAGLEKYLGSGLIKGVGPKTAQKIVKHFGGRTLEIFESHIDDLLQVPGIAKKKLAGIKSAWLDHCAVRDVMIFLQGHGISTLFAVRIYKKYGDQSIALVQENPYRLARDFYGIGFISADRVALALGVRADSGLRGMAAIAHVLSASRDQGHCFLTRDQIANQVSVLLDLDPGARLDDYLHELEGNQEIKVRSLAIDGDLPRACYYNRTLFFEEQQCADYLAALCCPKEVEQDIIYNWLLNYGQRQNLQLSPDQVAAVAGIASCGCSILTGGPGCGKTTTTKTLVAFVLSLGERVLLAAPTGRAAQRMSEVIGLEAKTIHRLLEYQNGRFKHNRETPLAVDCLIVDECSMLDISLAAALLSAIPAGARLILIGDADQLPSVGAGNVLADLMASYRVPVFTLNTVFRQAGESLIVRYAHAINRGEVPQISSPFKEPLLWKQQADCLFLDSSEATQQQLRDIAQAREFLRLSQEEIEQVYGQDQLYDEQPMMSEARLNEMPAEPNCSVYTGQVDLDLLQTAENRAGELRAVLKKIHPWSSLHYGLTARDVILRLCSEWIPKYFGKTCEIQVLSPMTRASLGTVSLNQDLQRVLNSQGVSQGQLVLGDREFRVGDRVIHRRNNYDLGVFNGDIGEITAINNLDLSCQVRYPTDNRVVEYQREDISELDLAYAITIHKSQGSEFDCVIIPVVSQHFKMLYRNLLYTGLTRARKLAILVGTRQAFGMAIRNQDTSRRQTALASLLRERCPELSS
ncbi:MAG: AAA family ATPase [Desulfobulbaceae bacterium]|uniref:AAA family ATPase n=1 Tax=Candidatus Desulfatifera sulfidica TaxID=2841691 RepID=A0A8J6T9W8_9BACT|nr:AAA family ATPase [Candidatus Desulfatifera sulfidica]